MNSRVMLHLDFSHAVTTPVGHYRYETVELAVQLQMTILNQFVPVGFETIIDVMQVNAGHFADHTIEDARREGFRKWIKTRVFPTRNQVIPLIEFGQEIWNLSRVILQVTIHGKNDLATTATETGYERWCLAKILAESNHTHDSRMSGVQFFQFQKGFIGTAIIDKNDFIGLTKGIELR